MTNIIWLSIFLLVLLFIVLFYIPEKTMKTIKSLYHVVLIPYDVSHKPILPSKRYDEYLIVLNQSSFIYNLDASQKQYEFRVTNQTLSKKELQDISKELLPVDINLKFYIF